MELQFQGGMGEGDNNYTVPVASANLKFTAAARAQCESDIFWYPPHCWAVSLTASRDNDAEGAQTRNDRDPTPGVILQLARKRLM